jgi:protein gp37
MSFDQAHFPFEGEIEQKSTQRFFTQAQWELLTSAERELLLSERTNKSSFNKTNDNVEWALWTWNPVTGCLHDCPYCYARDIANRFYAYLPLASRFAPMFYPDRLSAPANTRIPNLAKVEDPVRKLGLQNVFVCSMADLFGKWVPTEWIEAILTQVWLNPQWNFLFLTKFPIRMSEFEYPPNAWLGTTVDRQYAVERAEKAFRKLKHSGYQGIAWLSCEPMMERLTFSSLAMFNWIVIGGASKSTQTQEFLPPLEWISHLEGQAEVAGCKIYEKTNLFELKDKTNPPKRRREYPGFT